MRLGLVTDIHNDCANLSRALERFAQHRVDQVVTIGDTCDACVPLSALHSAIMTLDPDDPVHPANCDSVEQQDSRVIWRWAFDSAGRYANWMTHEGRLKITIAGMVGRLLQKSEVPSFHDYLAGEIDYLVSERLSTTTFRFGGCTTWGDGKTNRGWIAPFSLTVGFEAPGSERPRLLRLCFGVHDGHGGAERKPQGLRDERPATAELIFGGDPTNDSEWAVIVEDGG